MAEQKKTLKKLSIADIKKENKSFNEKKKIILSDEYYVYIYPNFSPLMISEYINDTIKDYQSAKEQGINIEKITMEDWGLYNIICKFTDLGIPHNVKDKVQLFPQIMNSKYWIKIIESFPEESFQRLNEALNNFGTNLQLKKKNELNKVEQPLDDEKEIIQ